MSRRVRHYRLPDYTETTSAEVMLNAWHDLVAPLEQKFNWTMSSFDPGVVFRTPSGEEIHLSVRTVREMVAQLW